MVSLHRISASACGILHKPDTCQYFGLRLVERAGLTVAVRFAFCRGTTWLGVIGTAGYFIVVGPLYAGSGGVAGPANEAPHEDEALLWLMNESLLLLMNGSECERPAVNWYIDSDVGI